MTQPQAVSAASDSDAERRAVQNLPDDLICAPEEIFDGAAVDAALVRALADADAAGSRRAAIVAILKEALTRGRAAIRDAFLADPIRARPTTRAYTYLTDCVVRAALGVAMRRIHTLSNPTSGEKLSLLAVGGYGRGEMAPKSDVDLLFLTPYKITPWAESVIEEVLYILWDLRLKVGHASRTVRDCLRLARDDYTIRTSLLENRHLDGDPELYQELNTRLWDDLFRNTVNDFVEAKLSERAERHIKQGGQRYVVEPNVKEGKGGLRDLQSLFWIAKYAHKVSDAGELVALGFFRQDEFDAFQRAENFLWAVRSHIHIITGRATDQLNFDLQVEVAAAMKYTDRGGRRAVEHFMQDYFLHATRVGELTRIFLTQLEDQHMKKAPSLSGLFRRRRVVKPPYSIRNNRLTYRSEKEFLSDKLNLLRIFEEALRTGYLLHPDAMRLVPISRNLIDDDMRNDPEAQKIFLDLMLRHGNPERALRRMNECGILAAFIPEFKPIVAMMQFNMYHSYTVDEHTIQCISNLAQIEREELREELPIVSGILQQGINRKVIYAALLLHDIGKGRDEDHSVLGAKIARKVGPRLGLNADEAETVEWLVRYHLLMSDVAQKRDIADPRTVRDFAKAVRSKKRLDLLTVLTVCDIRGVGPDVWNNWKAQLLRGLYRSTAEALENGLEDLNRSHLEKEAKSLLRKALPDWAQADLRHETGRHYSTYWSGFHTDNHVVFARMLKGLRDDEIRIEMEPDPDRDATRACFTMVDHPGLFSRITGALALAGANIVDARSFTTKDGYVTSAFWIQDAEGAPFEQSRLKRLTNVIHKTLKGEVVTRDALKPRDKIKKREREFIVPTSITFDNEGSEIYTIIEVDTRDRPALLFDLTRTLANANVYIASAIVATYGAQVVDTFYVKDMFGLKYHSKSKQKTLEKKLRAAIERGAEMALT